MTREEMSDIGKKLAAPFDPEDIGWLPKKVSGNRAMGIAYVSARAVMDRLDEVVGVGNWSDRYDILNDGCVVCSLTVTIGDKEVTKIDVGCPSDQPDHGDKLKASFSDALKRVAVKFGIGRTLYRLPQVWSDYDPVKKCFVTPPQLPAWYFGNDPPKPQQQPPKREADAPKPQPAAEPKVEVFAADPDSPPVTPEQVSVIRNLVTVSKLDPTKFLAAYGLDKLQDMRANQYENAVARLKKRAQAVMDEAAKAKTAV